ncbi:MAG: transcriptional repressor LexA [Clostridiales bacterium]|jgi:repressor LexA|nr:transcriptional repressor LexA [Clostridiales bacterium]
MKEGLSPKESKILNYLTDFLEENHYPPSVREICKAVGINSTATVYSYLNKLQSKGYIKKTDNKKRAMEVLREYSSFPKKREKSIPLVGKITAGEPILAVENIEDVYTLPSELFSSGELFMLNVQGESMINAGIFNGDKIIVRKQSTAENSEIVAAMIDGNATVKRFYKEANHIRLQPENDAMTPIIVDEAEILGVIVGLIRKL